ncbi:hypothetical protein CCMSSC00406_0005760 [Pleurotus cornucopiae]|uniref:Uncharacterized protein n=1 Tax=Pleurotus cornucopiae TaxID=5321 RepID=A0ACB7JB06_PLECO|nr:hypothetical protein CCMSSC00406_0005760 [Pleurotus cornucopiae]
MVVLRINATALAVGPYTIILLLVNIPLFAFIPAAQLYKSRFREDHAVVFNDSKMATLGLRSVIWVNISCSTILVPVLFINSPAHIIVAQFLPTPGVVILLVSLMLAAAFTSALAGALPYFALISALDERDATGTYYSEFWQDNEAYLKYIGLTRTRD